MHAVYFCHTFKRFVELVVIANFLFGYGDRTHSVLFTEERPNDQLLLPVKIFVLDLHISPILHPSYMKLVPLVLLEIFM